MNAPFFDRTACWNPVLDIFPNIDISRSLLKNETAHRNKVNEVYVVKRKV
jgi:hypothetical protein